MSLRDPLFTISLSDVESFMNSGVRHGYVTRLHDRLPQFKQALMEELKLVAEDAIMVAFMRTVPELAEGQLQEYAVCDSCKQKSGCTCLHPFVDMDHCFECLGHWTQTHTLQECLTSPHLSICTQHMNHSREKCDNNCPLHVSEPGVAVPTN